MEDNVSITRKIVDLPGGKRVVMFSLLEDRYHVWVDLQGFHRWALSTWADNGLGGIATHGKSMTLSGAEKACRENNALRKEIGLF